MVPYYERTYSVPHITEATAKLFGITRHEKTPGQVKTSYPDPSEDLLPAAWMETFKNLGHTMGQDPFSGASAGAFVPLASVDPSSATRCYSATAYYAPVQERTNLQVLTSCSVQKVLFEGKEPNLKAIGVVYLSKDGSEVTVHATREVILAAGTLQTPKILELSGISGHELLNFLGIPVLIDNPHVGENLQDHIVAAIGYEAKDDVPTKDGLVRNEPAVLAAAMEQYATDHTGPFALLGMSSYAYLPLMELFAGGGKESITSLLHDYAPTSKAPELEKMYYNIANANLRSHLEASVIFLAANAQQNATPTVPPSGPQPGNYISLGAALTEPFSRGNVHITSSNAAAAPAINPNYMSHPLDLEVFGRHLLYLHTIAKSEPFNSTLLKAGGRLRDPASNFTTLDEAKAYVKTGSISMWHPSSTCSMLPRDVGGVVDTKLLVYGTSNLRIVDASIFPLIPRGNLQATVYAVAERAADIVKLSHNL